MICVPAPITPNDSFQLGNAKVSRSGRTIKPPLEYWKGGRIVMDSDMNVTIHEAYSTSALSTVLFTFHLFSDITSFYLLLKHVFFVLQPKKPLNPTTLQTMNDSLMPETFERGVQCVIILPVMY